MWLVFSYAYLFYEQLYYTCSILMFVLFDRVANIKWLAIVNVLKMLCHIKSNTIHHFSRGVIDKLEFYVLQLATNQFACAKINYTTCAEDGFVVAGTKWIESSQ